MTQSPYGGVLTDRELATTLAALRHWQRAVPENDAHTNSPLHFKSARPLSSLEIDALCEKLNCGNDTHPFGDAIRCNDDICRYQPAKRHQNDKQKENG